MELLDITPWYS